MTFNWLATYYIPVGLMIGIAAAAPIGPVNILVIQRALHRGMWSALALGFGAALGDAVFALVAAFGLTALKILMNSHQDPLRLAGGLIMIGFGVFVWRSAPHLNDPGRKVPLVHHMVIATFTMTVTNPATILWFAATFGSIGFKAIGHATSVELINSAKLVGGVFLGSILWWLSISSLAVWAKGRLADRHLLIFNHISAIVLIFFGIAAMIAGIL